MNWLKPLVAALVLQAAALPLVAPTARAELADVEPGQLDRCLASLTADGLVAEVDGGRGLYALA